MTVQQQVIQVTDEGVQQVIADLQRINAGLDGTSRKATQAARDVDAANARGSALGRFLGRARDSGFLRKSGIDLGPVRIGSGGIGLNFGRLMPAAGAVLGTAHALGGVSEVARDVREFIDRGYKVTAGEAVQALWLEGNIRAPARMLNNMLGITRTGANFGVAFGLGTQAEYDGVLERLDDMFKSSVQRRIENEEKQRLAAAKAAVQSARESEERKLKASIDARLRAIQDKIDAETNRAVARIHRSRFVGVRFERGEDQVQAERQIAELNERMRRLEGERAKKAAAEAIKNRGS